MAMRVLGIIPARGGSKGLPRKNLCEVGGLSLVAHAIRCAELCTSLTETVVSTDDEEIAEAALDAGGSVYGLRPVVLATDTASSIDVCRFELGEAEQRDRVRYDAVCLLPPTTPLRLPSDVDLAIGMAAAFTEHPAVGVARCDWNPWWMLEATGPLGGSPCMPVMGGVYTNRQSFPATYRLTGSVYVMRPDDLTPRWLSRGVTPVDIPSLRAVDIDTKDDLLRARALVDAGAVELPWL